MKSKKKFSFPDQVAFWILAIGLSCIAGNTIAQNRDFYQIKIYSLGDDQQEERVDRYLEKAFLPALQRAGLKGAGVFKPVEQGENQDRMIFVLIPFESLDQFVELPSVLDKDKRYQQAGDDYINASHDNPPYKRIESILLRAFEGMKEFGIPRHSTPRSEQIYELRSYQGATEKLYESKVEMFNEAGEIDIFVRLGFQPVFFGEVISGSVMPNLMYLTTHADSDAQQKNWKAFGNDPDWVRIREIEKYKNTVSHIDKYLLHPAEYSDF